MQDCTDLVDAPLTLVLANYYPFKYSSFNEIGGVEAPVQHHINNYLDYFLPLYSFQDLDKDKLHYKISTNQNLTALNWLNYQSNIRKFYGTPKKRHMDFYNITIEISDGINEVISFLLLNITNNPPKTHGTVPDMVIDLGDSIYLSFRS